jgi:hypothetical protein
MCSIEACVDFRCAFVLMHLYIVPLDDLVHEQFQNIKIPFLDIP